MFDLDGPAEQHPRGRPANGANEGDRHQQQMPVPFSSGRKLRPRSVRIVSMQNSNAATGAGIVGVRRREHQQ